MRRQRGFTLIELLIVLAVTAVLASLVAPSFNEQLSRRRIEGVATELSTDLHFARSHATSFLPCHTSSPQAANFRLIDPRQDIYL